MMMSVQWVCLTLSWLVFICSGGCTDLRSCYGSDVLRQDSSEGIDLYIIVIPPPFPQIEFQTEKFLMGSPIVELISALRHPEVRLVAPCPGWLRFPVFSGIHIGSSLGVALRSSLSSLHPPPPCPVPPQRTASPRPHRSRTTMHPSGLQRW